METIHNALLQETVHSSTLPSGMQVLVMPKPGFQKHYGVLAVNCGGIDVCYRAPECSEQECVPLGVAHFLEHQLFDKPWGNVLERFSDFGASADAYTSYSQSAYLFSGTDHLLECIRLLLELVLEPYFTPERVERERAIIAQEISMYEDTPESCLVTNLMKCLYQVHPVREDVIGTSESIKAIDTATLERYHSIFYHPENMVFFLVGDLDPEKTAGAVAEMIADRGYKRRGPVERSYPCEPPNVAQPNHLEQMDVSRPYFALGIKDVQLGRGRTLLKKAITTSLLWDCVLGGSSALYNDLYERGLIDDTFGTYFSAAPQFCYSLMTGETSDPAALGVALQEGLERLRRVGVQQDDFQRIKNKAIGHFLRAFDSLEFIAHSFVGYYFSGVVLFDYLEVLERIELSDVNNRLDEHLEPEATATAVIEPTGRK